MAPTTTKSSAKEEFPPAVMQKFDAMLDLISAKNAMIGRLISELAEAKDHFDKLISDVDEPIVKRGLRLRVGSIDRFLKEALA